jgi:hypothetical protein
VLLAENRKSRKISLQIATSMRRCDTPSRRLQNPPIPPTPPVEEIARLFRDVSAPTQTSVSFHLIYIKALPAALWLRQRASSEGGRPGAAITPNIEEGLGCQSMA